MNRTHGVQENMSSIEKHIQRNVPLAPYTTFNIGGPARFFVQPDSAGQFGKAVEWALKRQVQHFVLGGGANVLIHDDGFDGLIIHTGRLTAVTVEGTTIQAECGLTVDDLVDASLQHGLSGLEFAAGLPGTVGGALFMNARAYEGEFSSVVTAVHALRVEELQVKGALLQADELRFSYKHSIFQEGGHYVYSVRLSLSSADHGRISSKIDSIRQKRREAGQFLFPNAGCIFKNNYDVGKPTGMIIDELGLKGSSIGDAEVYREHGNFIINRGSATAEDVYGLIQLIEKRIRDELGVTVEREINLLGPWHHADG
jgi:UDP-N-acetylmuramate dehydrogenase